MCCLPWKVWVLKAHYFLRFQKQMCLIWIWTIFLRCFCQGCVIVINFNLSIYTYNVWEASSPLYSEREKQIIADRIESRISRQRPSRPDLKMWSMWTVKETLPLLITRVQTEQTHGGVNTWENKTGNAFCETGLYQSTNCKSLGFPWLSMVIFREKWPGVVCFNIRRCPLGTLQRIHSIKWNRRKSQQDGPMVPNAGEQDDGSFPQNSFK